MPHALWFLLLFAPSVITPVERYVEVAVSADGTVSITTDDGRRITPARVDPGLDGFEPAGATQAAVAPDHQSVGWLALYDWCCTSYPIPLQLIILTNGRSLALSGEAGEPIWFWRFQDGGRRIAFREETPHGEMRRHYELWDVLSGKRIADYRPEYDENGHDVGRPNEPRWVKALDAEESRRR